MAPRDPGPKNSTGLPPGTRFYSSFPFAGMNTQAAPTAISDQEFLWTENFIRLGDGKLRTAYDAGPALYRASTGNTIVAFFAYSIALNYYFAVFLSDGSAVQVSWPTGVTTPIGGAGLFYSSANPTSLPACVQYGVQYLLISNNNTSNDYWIWDGTLLYQKGTAAPNGVNILSGGSNYNTAPTMTVYGGQGSGIGLNATVNAGNVVEIAITNPGAGYEVGDFPQIAFSGGGSDSSAILTAGVGPTGVAAVNITAGGSGYTTATVAFSGGGGSGAAGTPIVGSGVSGATVTAMGSGYTGANVGFSGGGGSGATAVAVVNGGQVVSITITSPGSGYTSAPTIAITGDGTLATATAQIQGNSIIGVTMTANGSGYTSAPTVTFGGAGSSATGTAELNTSGGVASVTIDNAGTGFFIPPLLSFVGGGSPSAIATAVTTLTATSLQFVNVLSSGSLYGVPSGHVPTLQVYGGAVNGGVPTQATVAISAFAAGRIEAVRVTSGGAGYVVEPFINITQFKDSFFTDAGTGASFQPVLKPTTLGSVIISAQGANYSDAPTILVEPGANNAAYATISLMPYGLSGACMETYQRRVWVGNPAMGPFSTLPPQGNFSVTAPESLTDVATSDGGVLFTNSDAFLQTKYVAIKQSNGYLYFVGDGSCSVVSGVNTSSAAATSTTPAGPPTTTFNYQTVDPQVGGSWRDAVQDFGRNILIANETGVFSLVGGSTSKASDKMDDVFLNAVFPPTMGALTPSAALAHLFNVKHYFILMTVTDPDTGLLRNVMLTFNGRDWSVTSQTPNLTYIGPQKRGSQFYAWGTDGTSLYPLFNAPSSALTKRLDTKLFGANDPIVTKEVQGFYIQAQDKSANAAGVAGTVSLAASGAVSELGESTPNQVYTDAYVMSESMGQMGVLLQQPSFPAPNPAWPVFGTQTAGIPAMNVGVRFSTQSPDFVLAHMLLAYKPGPALA